MSKTDLVKKTAEYVKKTLTGESSGHDWWHIWRVWRMAERIAKNEGADLEVVALGALLHDIGDWKFFGGDETVGPKKAREWLEVQGANQELIKKVEEIVAGVSFKGAGVEDQLKSLDGWVVQDADRLDAMGAMGIARTFAFGGYAGRVLYDPEITPQTHKSKDEYFQQSSPTLNHFYEKLLLLKNRMHTKTARTMAEKRHKYLETFLEEFLAEWNGER